MEWFCSSFVASKHRAWGLQYSISEIEIHCYPQSCYLLSKKIRGYWQQFASTQNYKVKDFAINCLWSEKGSTIAKYAVMGGIQLKEAGTFWSCSSLWPRVRHGQDPLAIVLHLTLGGRTLPSTPMARDNPGAPHPTWPHHIRTPSSNASLIAHEAHLKILVLKGVAIDGFSASTISLGDVLTTRCCTPTLKWGISCCLQVPTGRPVSDPHVVSPTPPPKKNVYWTKKLWV